MGDAGAPRCANTVELAFACCSNATVSSCGGGGGTALERAARLLGRRCTGVGQYHPRRGHQPCCRPDMGGTFSKIDRHCKMHDCIEITHSKYIHVYMIRVHLTILRKYTCILHIQICTCVIHQYHTHIHMMLTGACVGLQIDRLIHRCVCAHTTRTHQM